MIRGDGEG
jgi:hypothetical protein